MELIIPMCAAGIRTTFLRCNPGPIWNTNNAGAPTRRSIRVQCGISRISICVSRISSICTEYTQHPSKPFNRSEQLFSPATACHGSGQHAANIQRISTVAYGNNRAHERVPGRIWDTVPHRNGVLPAGDDIRGLYCIAEEHKEMNTKMMVDNLNVSTYHYWQYSQRPPSRYRRVYMGHTKQGPD
ncbi:hypothetical protein OBBRIDRAFT_247808 [Obba rivulosa]|uniref:Uncharacterized protein n=1 Tax=Obba rivulosa TaxID=1052685 RepID=A0A8E2AVT1_9APHY|nr:hypothetical protein OBBRIDRAFT_247808 [Obba rivulosa]